MTAADLRASLHRDIIDRWFPACVSASGFHEEFDAEFRPIPSDERMVIFQARMTWVCAKMGMRDYAKHGVRFLRDHLWDENRRAFRWNPERDDEYHAYAGAFAIYGLAAAGAVDLALEAFLGLEALYDNEFGGYFECMDSSGQVLQNPVGEKVSDGIGTPVGLKSQNSLLHLMEAFTELYAVWPDPLLGKRLAELLDWFRGRLMNPAGGQFGYTTREGVGIPGSVSYGHDIEAAHLMLAAADALGVDCLAEAVALGENVLAFGWDDVNGGTFFSGPPGQGADRRFKNWWVQAEALLGYATLAARTGDARFARAAEGEWEWIRRHQIDSEFGGWHETVSEDGTPVIGNKGHSWKAAYHDGRALLITARLLDDPKLAELFRADA